ncbi:IS3 family transposase [Nesterenkonia salmonea]|uniref:IS3 family transposase n=1 Tax=Nesterenkonia salmonea TaxID=1804987 RepID=UPI0014095FDF|nr:IS3 family transposase [Nesterenkonia salmonea]
MIRFQFVEDHRGTHEVKRMCQVLQIQRSSYYKWQAGRWARQQREQADDRVLARIRDHHQEWDHTLGYRRMTVELNADQPAGEPLNHKRVARLMRAKNIVGVHLRKPKTTTVKDPGAQVFGDLINLEFTAETPGEVYVGDVTYLPYGQKGEFLYLATVIDLCSKRLVGWSIADHMRTSLVENAMHHAAAARGSLDGAIFGSDHGRQYTSSDFQATCRRLGVRQSMGRIGSCLLTG